MIVSKETKRFQWDEKEIVGFLAELRLGDLGYVAHASVSHMNGPMDDEHFDFEKEERKLCSHMPGGYLSSLDWQEEFKRAS